MNRSPLPYGCVKGVHLARLATPALDVMATAGALPAQVDHVPGVVALGASRYGLGFGDLALCHGLAPLVIARQYANAGRFPCRVLLS